MVLFRCIAQQASEPLPTFGGSEPGLSRREQQIVELLRERLTNKEMAARLNLSEQTVKNHVHHVLGKVGAPNRAGIVESSNRELTRAAYIPYGNQLPGH